MAMFDYFSIDKALLPISNDFSDADKFHLPDNVEWQTKSLNRALSKIRVVGNQLTKIGFGISSEPVHSDSTDDNLQNILAGLKSFEIEPEDLSYTGVVNFYSTIENNWFDTQYLEFNAYFQDGKLTHIKQVVDIQKSNAYAK